MIALVTGATGFIGSHLVDALRTAGHEVRVLTRPLPVDDDLVRAPIWHGVTHLIHLAARTRAPDARAFHESNVAFTERLLRAACAQPVPPRMLFVSSLAASGPALSPTQPRTELDTPAPIERYGASKLAAEQHVRAAACPWTIVRPPAVYGPRDRDFATVFRQLQRPLHWRATPGWHAFTLTHVHDVVSALIAAAFRDEAVGRTYHLSGDDLTWDAFYAAVAQTQNAGRSIALPVPSPLLSVAGIVGGLWAQLTGHTPLATPDKIALGRAPYWLSTGAALTRDTGWVPQVALTDGVRDTAAWYRANGWT